MGRTLKILLIAVGIFIAYIWLSLLFKSCNNKNKSIETPAITKDKDISDSKTLDKDLDFIDEDTTAVSEETINYDNIDKTVDNAMDAKQQSSATTSPTTSSVGTGQYLVIAGNYLVEDNAAVMVRKIKNLGFSAEKVNFDLSQYHSVVAGRYATQSEAASQVAKLKAKGIDCYTKRRE